MAKRTMIFKSILVALISLISTSKCDSLSEILTNTTGFTVDLIHRDSPQSPLYDPSLSPSQRLANALRRSFDRVRRFKTNLTSSKSLESDITLSNGEYLMKYSIGTPPIPSLAIADTGSDIIWTQCQPCIECFKQKLPIFEPKKSPTYKTIPCNSPQCKYFEATSCSKDTMKKCLFSDLYGDGSFVNGELATDTITLNSNDGKTVSFPNIVFGCGFKNGGIFNGGESGIVGLGGGKASLVTQLGQGKFSYCLVSALDSKSSSSKLNFGDNAEVSGSGVVSTPLVKKDPVTVYYLTLDGISVGNQRLGFDDDDDDSNYSKNGGDGNMIIDSGTTLTVLPFDLFEKYLKAIRSVVKLKEMKDPQGVLQLCYYSKSDVVIPDITVHYRGADVKWKYENVFIRVSDVCVCLAVDSAWDRGIVGNLAQVNFLVGYDLVNRKVSFKAADCGKL